MTHTKLSVQTVDCVKGTTCAAQRRRSFKSLIISSTKRVFICGTSSQRQLSAENLEYHKQTNITYDRAVVLA